MNKKYMLLAISLSAISSYSAADTAFYIDPTGEIMSESPQDRGSLAPSEDGQVHLDEEQQPEPEQVPSPVPGGGMMVEREKPRDYR